MTRHNLRPHRHEQFFARERILRASFGGATFVTYLLLQVDLDIIADWVTEEALLQNDFFDFK
jgi:hypothetical protein